MNLNLRNANPGDVHGIARIAEQALAAHIDIDAPRVQAILSDGRAIVACLGDEVLGFADAFATLDAHGERRVELDLVAVATSAQGRGIGSALVERCIAGARRASSSGVRALVRTENSRMQVICRRAGFQRSAYAYHLYIAEGAAAIPSCFGQHNASLVKVDTLTYSGIWLEGDLNQAAVDEAKIRLAQTGSRIAGAVVPQGADAVVKLLRDNDFLFRGDFHWWALNLASDQS